MGASLLESHIESVTVFREEALVRRVAEITAEGDGYPTEVGLPDLPLCLDDASVCVRVESTNGDLPPRAPDVHLTLDVSRLEKGDLAPAENAELRAADREVRRLEAIHHAEEALRGRLEHLEIPRRRKKKPKDRPDGSPTTERLELLEFRTEKVRESIAREQELSERLREAVEHRDRLREDDRRSSTARQTREHELRKLAVIRIDSRGATADRARLVLEYLVPGGGWAPTYVGRFDRETSRVRLELRAMVAQKTGEDWTDVELTLSTADAQRFTELPEMTSLRIGRRQLRPVPTGWRAAPEGAEELYADYARAFAEPPAQAKEPVAKLEAAPPPGAGAPTQDAREDTGMIAAGALFEEEVLEESELVGGAAPSVRSMARGGRRRRSAPAPAPAATPLVSVVEEAGPGRPDADLLGYGSLLMPGPDEPGRGRLRVVIQHETYVEVLMHTAVILDVESALAGALSEAGSVRRRRPASGCVRPERGRFAYAYRASSTVTIPSDAVDHNIPLRLDDAEGHLRYVTVPREMQEAFRVASFRNPLGAPLLTGPVDLYLDDAYQMTGTLEHTPAGAEVELGFGVEPAIKVARNTSYSEESKGLVKGALELRHEIEVDIASLLPAEAEVEVRERVPVVPEGAEDLAVEIAETEPDWEEYDPITESVEGGYRWVRTLEPSETARLRAVYVIRIPSRSELVGGNRREVAS